MEKNEGGHGPRFCHFCGKNLRRKPGGGYWYAILLTPYDQYPVRVHSSQCAELALNDGYKKP